MTLFVLDASALLAVALSEPGGVATASRLASASMSTVNASEALMRGAEKGIPFDEMRGFILAHRIDLLPFDAHLALEAALLRPLTKRLGLSFADRACLATAIRLGATAITADRAWATLDLPCPIELIR